MFEAKIMAAESGSSSPVVSVAALRSMTEALGNLASNVTKDCQPYSALLAGSPHSLAAGYAAASPITRRRFEAVLREAETIGATGLALIAARSGRTDTGTIAAARFLGNSLSGSIRKLEALVQRRSA